MISSIYDSYGDCLPRQIKDGLKKTIEAGLACQGDTRVFFRADDIAVPSKAYARMMALFIKYRTPLCLAVVPAWMTRQRWEAMGEFHEKDLFCWHMHGYRHMNHETKGKNQEFGPGRPSRDIAHDLSRGRLRLQSIMGEKLTQVFTPPWNRCSLETMILLKEMGFKGISRSFGSQPAPPRGFKEFPVHVDLHTRKEKQAEKGWQNLLAEIAKGMEFPAWGIMIHHMRMNDQAFVFLEYLLELLARYKQVARVSYTDLI